jgi:hypothetical protein
LGNGEASLVDATTTQACDSYNSAVQHRRIEAAVLRLLGCIVQLLRVLVLAAACAIVKFAQLGVAFGQLRQRCRSSAEQ